MKEDPQNVANYRPVTLLPAVDNIFEQLLYYQFRDKFETIFDNSMSAYRKCYSCEGNNFDTTGSGLETLDGYMQGRLKPFCQLT